MAQNGKSPLGRVLHGALTVALHPVLTMPGYWTATAFGITWGAVLGRGRIERTPEGLIVIRGLPAWAFGRGGVTVGGVYLTRDNISPAILEHEEVHRKQWRRFGLAMIPLYYASGIDPLRNHFEIQADLVKGGYLRAPSRPRPRTKPAGAITTTEDAGPASRSAAATAGRAPAEPARRRDGQSTARPSAARRPSNAPEAGLREDPPR